MALKAYRWKKLRLPGDRLTPPVSERRNRNASATEATGRLIRFRLRGVFRPLLVEMRPRSGASHRFRIGG